MNNEIAQQLLTYIANNCQTESKFLTPNSSINIEVIGLLDKIAELRNITKEENGIEFNKIIDILKY